jgi:hypothetical protein
MKKIFADTPKVRLLPIRYIQIGVIWKGNHMKIGDSGSCLNLWEIYFGNRRVEYGLVGKKAAQKPGNPFKRDSVEISQDARLEDIHRQVLSGKPLKGVTYAEFKKYSMKYDKQTADYEVSRLYKQALRGYGDILSKRDFYGEDFVLTDAVRLSAEYQAEGAKLRERVMAGEELNGYETVKANLSEHTFRFENGRLVFG